MDASSTVNEMIKSVSVVNISAMFMCVSVCSFGIYNQEVIQQRLLLTKHLKLQNVIQHACQIWLLCSFNLLFKAQKNRPLEIAESPHFHPEH